MNDYFTYLIGIIAQVLFSSRLIIQWFMSEKAKRSLSPAIFWDLSLIASLFLMIYGILRVDIAIVFGQVLSYYAYIGNLKLKKRWIKYPMILRILVYFLPLGTIIYLAKIHGFSLSMLVKNEEIPILLKIFGMIGTTIFSLRFVYQILISRYVGESVLSLSFWIISTIGSGMILIYSIFRRDPVLFAGQIFVIFIYIRNIRLHLNYEKQN